MICVVLGGVTLRKGRAIQYAGEQQGVEGQPVTWEACGEVERVPGKMGGRPVVKGTRIEPETLLMDAELGATPDETHESFPTVSVETIRVIVEYARRERSAG